LLRFFVRHFWFLTNICFKHPGLIFIFYKKGFSKIPKQWGLGLNYYPEQYVAGISMTIYRYIYLLKPSTDLPNLMRLSL
jgi:hypothetical protein